MHQGVRQGCPFSPYIFILFVEILGCLVRLEVKSDDLVDKLISGFTNVLNAQGGRVTHLHAPTLPRFSGKSSPGEFTLSQWLQEVDIYFDHCDVSSRRNAQVILNHLDGAARQQIRCHFISADDLDSLITLLKGHFGS